MIEYIFNAESKVILLYIAVYGPTEGTDVDDKEICYKMLEQ